VTAALSVVLATGHSGPAMALGALQTCGAHDNVEVVRVSPTGATGTVRVPPGTDVPAQWGAGAVAASAPVVAFTTSDMIVDASWTETLLAAVRGGAAGAAGEIRVARDAGVGVRAVYLARYSAYAPPLAPGRVTDIPADNAAYARRVLDLVPGLADGFWEAELHRRLPEDAGGLVLVRGAGATMIGAPPPLVFALRRFYQGRRFGAFRVTTGGESTIGIVLRAPLVPAVLLWRIARRCLARPGLRATFVTCFPLLVTFAVAWAVGEAMGALRPRPRRRWG
jgi:hypothetical protein